MKQNLLLISMLCCSLLSWGQRATVCGYVTDKESGERLIGATVYDTISQIGTVTNTAGFYSLTLPQGNHALQASYVGYNAGKVRALVLKNDTTISIRISSSTSLDEVVVVGTHKAVSGPESVQMSAVEIPVSQIKGIPAIGGEVDVLKAIQLLPGVQSGSEGSAGMYVRGGGPDENLMILDGVPLYNVNHLMGFFSVFNADAIKNVTLYKGNFPAQYGGRLSSIIDVRQNDGNTESYHGNITVGLLAAKFNLEGPIPHKKDSTGTTTFNISARRTYFDAFLAPIMASRMAGTGGTMTAGAYFYDVNAKLSHTFANQKDKLSASFYMGDDAIYLSTGQKSKSKEQEIKESMGLHMNWGNILAATNWEHQYNARLFSNAQLSYTRYRYKLTQDMEESVKAADPEDNSHYEQTMRYNSSLQDVSAKMQFEWTPLHNNTLHFGAEYAYHQFRPEVSNYYQKDTTSRMDTTYTDGKLHGHEVVIYAEDQWSPWRWLKLNVGLRGSLYAIDGKVYPSIEPRVGLRALITKDLAFKASYSYTTQYIHLLTTSSVSMPTDLWVPVTRNIAPMHSMIVAGGLSYNILDQVEASVEGYYKRSTNLVEYRDGASFMGGSGTWQDKVVLGDGWSYGVEVLLQRKVGPVTGWIGYTWSRTMRQFDRPGQEINFGKPFHAKYDREHDLSITLQYQITPRIDIAGTFVYGTGTRATLATKDYYDATVGANVPYFSERNNYKMPDYHRLDLGANFYFPNKKPGKNNWAKDAQHVMNVSIYNVYCNENPYMLLADDKSHKLYQVNVFPILPSISYTFKF